MLLAVDIGNTNIKMALFKANMIRRSLRIATDKRGTVKYYKRIMQKSFLKTAKKRMQIEGIIVCSVVPQLTSILAKALFSLLKKEALILGKDISAPIKNLYKKPKQVGQDRLVNAVAAVRYFGAPVIVVDFGTAVTFDAVSRSGCYLGGIIAPGIENALGALVSSAELLPKIKLAKPKAFLGKDTASSMRSGLIFGYSFLVEGILQRLKKELAHNTRVVATGGRSSLFSAYCPSITKIDDNLTLQGLNIIFQNAINRK